MLESRKCFDVWLKVLNCQTVLKSQTLEIEFAYHSTINVQSDTSNPVGSVDHQELHDLKAEALNGQTGMVTEILPIGEGQEVRR